VNKLILNEFFSYLKSYYFEVGLFLLLLDVKTYWNFFSVACLENNLEVFIKIFLDDEKK